MGVRIYEDKYKDLSAVSIENEILTATFLPKFGGKMASFRYKKTGREFLVQAEGEKYKKLEFAGDYVASECSGFDDMFPTIDERAYDKFPWQGMIMPDHGEVCGLKWEYEIEKNEERIHCWVYGVRLPYKMEKWIYFSDENELMIDYKITNLSVYEFEFIWAAHVMINAEENAEILAPYSEESDIICVFSTDEGFGKKDLKMQWPNIERLDKRRMDISKTLDRKDNGNNYKFYFDNPVPEGWCGYLYNSDKTKLLLKFTEDTLPYLGIWVNEGGFKGYHNIALEPCSATFDDPKIWNDWLR